MTPVLNPSLTLSAILAVLYAAVTQLIVGGDGRRLVFLCLSAGLGMALGQSVGDVLSIHALSMGSTNILAGTLGAAVALLAMAILSRRASRHL